MKKLVTSICLTVLSPMMFGQVYHAGETEQTVSSAPRWEVSAGVTRSNFQIRDGADERMFKSEDGLTARGLYYPVRWLGIGLQGTWFDKEDFAGDNTYKDTRYDLLTKWILTPDTRPNLYVLLGSGYRTQEVSYAHLVKHTKHNGYMLAALGLDVEISHGWFIGAEGQLSYFPHKEIDKLLHANKRTERVLNVRVGVRF